MQANRSPVYFTVIMLFLQFLPVEKNQLFAQIDYQTYKISLLTYSPGDKLYSIFGHSALRIQSRESDWVFNYGTFDFDDPKFYADFMWGKLTYRLSRLPFDYALQVSSVEDRSLFESPLHLTETQKAKIVSYLEMNYLPENRAYQYDFLYDNCATRIMDVINFGISNLAVYNPLAIPKKSFRSLLNPYLNRRPWVHIGVDFLMGLPADKKTQGTEASFLPDYLHLLVKNASVNTMTGETHDLCLHDIVHVQKEKTGKNSILQPEWILWPLVLICLISFIFGTYFSVFFKYLYKIILIVFGILGIVLLFLWFTTQHYIFNFNTDILWANPLLLSILFMGKRLQSTLRNHVLMIYLVLLFMLASLGSIASLFVEKNLNITAISFLVLSALYDKIRSLQRLPEHTVSFD
jgi:hypothetical protein